MYMTHLHPRPVSFTENADARFTFGTGATLYLNRDLPQDMAQRIKALWHRFCCTASALTIAVREEKNAPLTAWIGQRGELSAEYYALRVTESGVTLCGKDEKALLDGFTTLVQLIVPDELKQGCESFHITAAQVCDAPSLGMRAIHLCVFPDSDYFTLEKAIHLAGFLKLTHLVLEFWGTLRYECLPELGWKDKSLSMAQAKHLVDLARSYGMEVIPMFNHLGHATGCRVIRGKHVVLDQNPRLATLFEPDGWTWCVSNPATQNVLREVRAELMALCGDGSYFHLGMDEAYSFASCERCKARGAENLLVEHINSLTAELSAQGRRPILWGDEFLNSAAFDCPDWICAAGVSGHNCADALDRIDRRAIFADWQYYYKSGVNPTAPYFIDHGFDTVLCPWDDPANIAQLSDDARKFGASGVMLTTWNHLPGYLKVISRAADAVWQRSYPDPGGDRTETAALLRKLYDAQGDFTRAGFLATELDPMPND